MKRITMADVAEKAGVSKSTVSQYMNNRFEYMSEETKQKIKEVIEELDYQVNIVARSLTQKRTSTIGIIVANILHNFSTQVIRAIEDYFNRLDIHVIVCNADDDSLKERKYIEMLRAKQVDGLVVFPTGGNIDLYESLVKENFPLVFMDRIIKNLNVETVLLDNKHASALAVEHLLSNGHQHIAIITTSIIKNTTPRIERLAGYRKCIEENGLKVNEDYVVSQKKEHLYNSINELMNLEIKPTAIFAANDLSLMEVLKYMKKHNIKMPTDISIISIDDVPYANIYTPTLTTIAQPAFAMGEKASNLLMSQIENANLETKGSKLYKFKGELILRESVNQLN